MNNLGVGCRSLGKLLAVVAGAMALSGFQGTGRPLSREEILSQGYASLKASISLDRQSYFVFEEIYLTVTLENVGLTPVEVFEPFRNGLGRLLLERQRPNGEWASDVSFNAPDGDRAREGPVTTMRVPSGGSLTRRIRILDESCFGGSAPPWCTVPVYEGNYRLRALLGNLRLSGPIEARFQIIQPDIYLRTSAETQRFVERKPGWDRGIPAGSRVPPPARLKIAVAAVEHGGQFFLLMGRGAGPDSVGRTRYGRMVGSVHCPCFRVGPTASKIVGLQAVADAAENLTVTYTEENGRTSRLRFDHKRDLISER